MTWTETYLQSHFHYRHYEYEYIVIVPSLSVCFCRKYLFTQQLSRTFFKSRISSETPLIFPRSPTLYFTITRPCDGYPLTPHFYIVNLGFTGVYISFLVLL